MILLLSLLACSSPEAASASLEPVEIGLAECAVCGMVVREQPAPRAQVLHRDGERAHLCSIGDLRAHLAAPSPHGKAHGVWVEALPTDLAPDQIGSALRPWQIAERAGFVLGVPRAGVMGEAVLSYGSAEEAQAEAARLSGRTVSWSELSPPQR